MSNKQLSKDGCSLNALSNLISELSKLPGLGERSAERLAFHILKMQSSARQSIADSIISLRDIKLCQKCFNLVGNIDEPFCDICSDDSRERSVICVVEQIEDLWRIEKTDVYKGLYHVLHGVISPLDGKGPEDITLEQLINRVKSCSPKEIILSTNPTVEGDNTALYIQKELKKPFIENGLIKITRLGRGVPVGSSIEYLNKAILISALMERKESPNF
ncbi:MAG: recombination mediator RecR [Planctomycetota bacterium]|nr:recombination mediator RecR [Planctomycetota bacterium]